MAIDDLNNFMRASGIFKIFKTEIAENENLFLFLESCSGGEYENKVLKITFESPMCYHLPALSDFEFEITTKESPDKYVPPIIYDPSEFESEYKTYSFLSDNTTTGFYVVARNIEYEMKN